MPLPPRAERGPCGGAARGPQCPFVLLAGRSCHGNSSAVCTPCSHRIPQPRGSLPPSRLYIAWRARLPEACPWRPAPSWPSNRGSLLPPSGWRGVSRGGGGGGVDRGRGGGVGTRNEVAGGHTGSQRQHAEAQQARQHHWGRLHRPRRCRQHPPQQQRQQQRHRHQRCCVGHHRQQQRECRVAARPLRRASNFRPLTTHRPHRGEGRPIIASDVYYAVLKLREASLSAQASHLSLSAHFGCEITVTGGVQLLAMHPTDAAAQQQN